MFPGSTVVVAEHGVGGLPYGLGHLRHLIFIPLIRLAAQEGGLVHPLVEHSYRHMVGSAVSLYGDGVLHISVLYEILHIVTAIVSQHYRHWHSVMQVGTGIVWIRPVRVLAAGLLGRDPDIEYHGIFQYLWTEHGQVILPSRTVPLVRFIE